MPIYALVAFVIIGAFAGWLGGMLLKGRGLAPIGNVVVGAIGACVGGILVSAIGLFEPGAMGSLFAAVIGAAVLLLILGLSRKP